MYALGIDVVVPNVLIVFGKELGTFECFIL